MYLLFPHNVSEQWHFPSCFSSTKVQKTHTHTFNINASPAMCSTVVTQALVLFWAEMLSPLKHWNTLQKYLRKLSLRHTLPNVVGTVLQERERGVNIVNTDNRHSQFYGCSKLQKMLHYFFMNRKDNSQGSIHPFLHKSCYINK